MATVGSNYITWTDIAKRSENGMFAQVIEECTLMNPILEDAYVAEGNETTGNLTTRRTSLQDGTFRQVNAGIAPGKSGTDQRRDQVGYLDGWVDIDCINVDIAPDGQRLLADEASATFMGMSNTMASQLFYGDTSTVPEGFDGFDPRYDVISTTRNDAGYQIIDATGTDTDMTSIWLVEWGPMSCQMVYGKGSPSGGFNQAIPWRKTIRTDSSGNGRPVFESYWEWHVGLAVKATRSVVRIANIDISDLVAGSGADLAAYMARALHKQRRFGGRNVFYVSETVAAELEVQLLNKSGSLVRLGMDEWAGKETTMFRDVPIRKCESILETETQIS